MTVRGHLPKMWTLTSGKREMGENREDKCLFISPLHGVLQCMSSPCKIPRETSQSKWKHLLNDLPYLSTKCTCTSYYCFYITLHLVLPCLFSSSRSWTFTYWIRCKYFDPCLKLYFLEAGGKDKSLVPVNIFCVGQREINKKLPRQNKEDIIFCPSGFFILNHVFEKNDTQSMCNEPQDNIFFLLPLLTDDLWFFTRDFILLFVVFLNKNGVRVSHEMDQCKAGHRYSSAPSCQTSTDFDIAISWLEISFSCESQMPLDFMNSRPVLSHRNFVGDGFILCHSIQKPQASCGYWAVEMWLVRLRNTIFNFFKKFNSNVNGYM